MTDRDLTELGDALERAAAADLAATRRSPLRTRRLVAVCAVLAIAVPGIAYAASALIGPDDVAASLPAGTRMLQGTDPVCTVVEQDVEYHCTLSRPPADPEVDDLMGTVEPTVDATKHVNGGCRSLTSEGLVWQCYIGEAAVEQQIIGPDFLGAYAPEPGVG
jgi:hypothetical protein